MAIGLRWGLMVGSLVLLGLIGPGTAQAVGSSCEDCHLKLTPNQVADFNSGVMAQELSCADCHGREHSSAADADKAKLPSIATCNECHLDQASQYLVGKHALGYQAMVAMPYTHQQPTALIQGRKGCGGCHTLGVLDDEARQVEERKYYRFGMDCQNCHTRHRFSRAEAREPEACQTCHMGFDHAQWEMWSGSKHGVTYLINRQISPEHKERTPSCQFCHMPEGDHRVYSPWGFFAVRLPLEEERDPEWRGFRKTILQGMGILDPEGRPTDRMGAVEEAKVVRLDRKSFDQERKRLTDRCLKCHSPDFVSLNIKAGDQMIKEADRLLAEAIEIVAGLYQDGLITRPGEGPAYPDLLAFYEVPTKIEQTLYEMFMEHRMKAFQASFHANPDYATWYGFAKMKKDLTEIREMAKEMRAREKD